MQNAHAGLTRTEISNYLGNNKPAAKITQALGVLLRHGMARLEKVQTGGREAERWFAAGRR